MKRSEVVRGNDERKNNKSDHLIFKESTHNPESAASEQPLLFIALPITFHLHRNSPYCSQPFPSYFNYYTRKLPHPLEDFRRSADVTNVLQGSPDMLEGPRVEESSPAGSYQLPVCCLCARVWERSH